MRAALAACSLGLAAPGGAQNVTLSPEAASSYDEINSCAGLANQGTGPSTAVLAQVNRCVEDFLRGLEALPPEDQYNLSTYAFWQFPCFGFGPQKDLIVQRTVRAAQTLGNFDAAIIALFNRGVCYWNDQPANFERALQNFEPFRNALAPYVNPRWLDSPESIRREAFIFREAARRYIRFLENAYRIDAARRGRICGGVPNHCLAAAWTLTQRVKARLFHSRMIQVFVANDVSGGLGSLLRDQYRLNQSQEALRLGLATATGDTPQAISMEIARVEGALARNFPEYVSLYQGFAPSIDELRSSLQENEVYLAYLFTDDARRMIAFRITPRDPPRFIRLPGYAADIKQRVRTLNDALLEESSDAELEAMLRQLGSDLLDPLDIPAGARLIIEADEELSAMPFSLAIANGSTLGASHEITYVPSAGVFRNLRNARPGIRGTYYLGLGRTSFPDRPPPNDFLGAVGPELAAAASTFGGAVAVNDPEASESLLYDNREALARARVLHLASHTEIRDGEVALQLHEGDGEDGRLTESDILARIRTGADLVVLSGCDTATLNRTGDGAGEAFSALTRAFFAAGARRLLVTQWEVRDRFAGPFIQNFMNTYAANGNPARALDAARQAVRALPEASERDWAAWILVGD